MRLSEAQLRDFERKGFALGAGLLSTGEVELLRRCYMATVERQKRQKAATNSPAVEAQDDLQVHQIRTPHLLHPVFHMLIHDSRLLDLVEDLIGPDIRLIHYQGLCKPPFGGGEIGWRQDNYSFNVAENRTVALWLALDQATVESGCIWYLPGQHRRRMKHEQVAEAAENSGFRYVARDVDATEAVPAELEAGGFAVHHALTPHRSLKNRTDKAHRGFAMHFMDARLEEPPAVKLLPEGTAPVLRRGR